MRSIGSRTSCQNVIKTKIKVFRDVELRNNQQYIRLRRRGSSQKQRRLNPNPGTISNLIYHQIKQFYCLPTQCVYVFCTVLRTNNHYFTRRQYLTEFHNLEEVFTARFEMHLYIQFRLKFVFKRLTQSIEEE